jgi:hypothetical protein
MECLDAPDGLDRDRRWPADVTPHWPDPLNDAGLFGLSRDSYLCREAVSEDLEDDPTHSEGDPIHASALGHPLFESIAKGARILVLGQSYVGDWLLQ